MMTDREIQILKYAYPELIEAIESDYQEFSKNNKNKLLNEIFNDIGLTVIKQKNFLGTESIAQVSVTGFNISSSNKSSNKLNNTPYPYERLIRNPRRYACGITGSLLHLDTSHYVWP
jgi:hypothetical protein